MTTATSWLHRARASAKLGSLAVLVIGVVLLPSPLAVGLALSAVLLLYVSAGLSPVVFWRQVRPLRWILLALVAFQTFSRGWEVAAMVGGKLALTVALAGLVTLTTPATELLDVVERILARVPGVNAERAALVLSLAIRAIPVVSSLAGEVRDAQRARGAGNDIRAYGVPLVVRCLHYSDRMGEALAARGVDD